MEREPGVHDVLHEQDVPGLEGRVDVLQQPHPAALAVRVGRELDDVQGVRDGERAREVREEDDARLQRRDEDRVEPLVCPADLVAELDDACRDLVACQVDGADVAVLGSSRPAHYEARRSR